MAGLYWLWRKKRKASGGASGGSGKTTGIQWEDPTAGTRAQRIILPKMDNVMAMAVMGSQVR